jgi:hypothetical protein
MAMFIYRINNGCYYRPRTEAEEMIPDVLKFQESNITNFTIFIIILES